MIKVDILVCNSLENYLLDNPAGLDWEEYLVGEGGQEGKVDAKVSFHFSLRFDSHLAKQSLTCLASSWKFGMKDWTVLCRIFVNVVIVDSFCNVNAFFWIIHHYVIFPF